MRELLRRAGHQPGFELGRGIHLRRGERQVRKRFTVEADHQLAPLAGGSVTLEALQFLAFEHAQGREAGQLLELFGVLIDRRGGHYSSGAYST